MSTVSVIVWTVPWGRESQRRRLRSQLGTNCRQFLSFWPEFSGIKMGWCAREIGVGLGFFRLFTTGPELAPNYAMALVIL